MVKLKRYERRKLQRSNNVLSVNLPSDMAERLGVSKGDFVCVTYDKLRDRIMIYNEDRVEHRVE